jgi:hypothetical protein
MAENPVWQSRNLVKRMLAVFSRFGPSLLPRDPGCRDFSATLLAHPWQQPTHFIRSTSNSSSLGLLQPSIPRTPATIFLILASPLSLTMPFRWAPPRRSTERPSTIVDLGIEDAPRRHELQDFGMPAGIARIMTTRSSALRGRTFAYSGNPVSLVPVTVSLMFAFIDRYWQAMTADVLRRVVNAHQGTIANASTRRCSFVILCNGFGNGQVRSWQQKGAKIINEADLLEGLGCKLGLFCRAFFIVRIPSDIAFRRLRPVGD